MNQRRIQRLLRELTPEIRAYLFPGWEEPEVGSYAEEVSVLGDPQPMYEMGERPVFRSRRPGLARPSVRERSASAESDPEALDPRTVEILAEIRRLQDKYGVSIEELELLLGYTVRLSPLRILRSGRLFLTDYDGVEVKMPNIAKALYFLYLRHPEGLRYKDVADHRDELLELYGGITGRDDPAEIARSIDLLADPFGNALNVNASRIKAAFRNVVSDRIARFYYLEGAAGEVKKVPLDRDLVIWEY